MKDIKTIHAKINYATPRLLSIRHYFAAKMAVQKSGASWFYGFFTRGY